MVKKNNKTHNPAYFEGILQLRNPSQEAVDFIEKQVDKAVNVHIAKTLEIKNGIDIYLSSNSFLMKLGKKLQKEFGGNIKVSSTLHTKSRQTSKELYRVTFLIELPVFKKGDVIAVKKETKKERKSKQSETVIAVTSLDKKIHGISLRTGKKVAYGFEENIKTLDKHKVIVIKTHPDIEVMHPETYQNIKAVNKPKKTLKPGHKAIIVLAEDGALFV